MNKNATFTRRRRFAIAFNVILASLLAPAFGGLLCYLAFRPELRVRLDLTRTQSYTLSDKTHAVLGGLENQVDVYTCFRPIRFNSGGQWVPGLDHVIQTIALHTNDLLREYEIESEGKVKAHLYDPTVTGHFGRIENLSRRIGEPAQNLVIVERMGDTPETTRRKVLHLQDLADYDEGPKASESYRRPRLYGFRDEEAISGAILAVTEEKPTRIRFVVGHGERDPNAAGMDAAGRGGYSKFATSLRGQNFDVDLIDVAVTELDAATTDILVLASPTEELPNSELDKICRFVSEGGKLFLLMDPSTPIALDFALLDQTLGIRRLPGEVHLATLVGDWKLKPTVFDEIGYAFHSEIVKVHRDKKLSTLWNEVCAFEPLGRAEQSDFLVTPMVFTSKEAWLDLPGESGTGNGSFDPGSEKKLQRQIAMEVRLPNDGRAVVLGDSHILDDHYISQSPGNRPLGLNSIEWLAEREELISLPPQPYDELIVDLEESEYNAIFLYIVVAIPALSLLMAFAVFWARRQ